MLTPLGHRRNYVFEASWSAEIEFRRDGSGRKFCGMAKETVILDCSATDSSIRNALTHFRKAFPQQINIDSIKSELKKYEGAPEQLWLRFREVQLRYEIPILTAEGDTIIHLCSKN